MNTLASFMNLVGPDLIVILLILIVLGAPALVAAIIVLILSRRSAKAAMVPPSPNDSAYQFGATTEEIPVKIPAAQEHSGLGIVSFAVSLATGAGAFLFVMIAGLAEASIPGGLPQDSPWMILLGLLIIGCMILNLAGIAVGIAAVLQKDRKRVFAVLGIVFNIVTLIGMLCLMLLGYLAK
jgi:hypothetical protein